MVEGSIPYYCPICGVPCLSPVGLLLTVDMPHPMLQLRCSCPRLTCLGLPDSHTLPMLLLLTLVSSG